MKLTVFFAGVILLISLQSISGNPESKYFSKKYIKGMMTKTADWQLANPKHNLHDWTNGAFYAGIEAAYETTKSKKLLQAMIDMGEANEWKPGPRLHHADDHAICQTYIDVYRIKKDQKMIQPFVKMMDEFIATPYPVQEPMQLITWWWCDALFMAPPAYVKLGMTLKDNKYLELNDKLFKECYDLLYDKEEHLFARDNRYQWDQPTILKEANGKKIFWSRGNGWVMGGLVRVLEELPKDYKERAFYEKLFVEMSERVAGLQQEDGLWRASLLDPESYPGGEASGSGFYCYALAWGINKGILAKDKYLPVVKNAWAALNGLVQTDGRVGWCQPIGADPKKNFTAESWEVYGAGAFLLAGSEVIKL
ncbi:MAG: glycoside hydrolase family 88 protein [Prolixibacteraceae bacterium]|jgi:rhamnogalacturonyl hydrolase YesR|nr:glycoside hydrolase family 88 protein [Prolixibacteraceae bacterium]